MAHVPVPVLPGDPVAREDLSLERLADCVRRLDPATRALLDLSVRREVRDDQMAPMLQTDPFHLAWRRARALEAVASDLGGDSAASLAQVRAALKELPDEVWLLGAGPAALPRTTGADTTGMALVPAASTAVGEPAPGRLRRIGAAVERLDAFAVSSPTLRAAMGGLARALARKAVRTVVWRARRR